MNAGTENRKKTIAAGVLGAGAVLSVGFYLYGQLFGSDTPPPPPPSTTASSTAANAPGSPRPATTATSSNGNGRTGAQGGTGTGIIPGVAAQLVANTSASLDPTLDQTAMLRTESLLYSGAGRNIFSATYTLPTPAIPVQKISPRPQGPVAPVYTPPPPPPTCPPSCPPIPLKFFGTATHANGQRQAFLLQGEDVYLASTGDIVARKFKIGAITQNSVQVTDLQNNNTQSLPFQSQ
ncbi:MAG TPA: hypothetical protein VGN16_05690 [Acidobacteriaceae bacterium]|jgi:hypothetical protein